jgi:hypothetical protein
MIEADDPFLNSGFKTPFLLGKISFDAPVFYVGFRLVLKLGSFERDLYCPVMKL